MGEDPAPGAAGRPTAMRGRALAAWSADEHSAPGRTPMIEVRGLTKRYGDTPRRRRPHFHRPAGRGHRLPRPQRRRQVHHHADDPGPGRADQRRGHHRRPATTPSSRAAARGRRAAGAPRPSTPAAAPTTTCSSLAETNGIPAARVDEVLGPGRPAEVARRRAGGFSLGMGQRLGIAAALLGDPDADARRAGQRARPRGHPLGAQLMKGLAEEGRTVFVSSHLMSEMALTADTWWSSAGAG